MVFARDAYAKVVRPSSVVQDSLATVQESRNVRVRRECREQDRQELAQLLGDALSLPPSARRVAGGASPQAARYQPPSSSERPLSARQVWDFDAAPHEQMVLAWREASERKPPRGPIDPLVKIPFHIPMSVTREHRRSNRRNAQLMSNGRPPPASRGSVRQFLLSRVSQPEGFGETPNPLATALGEAAAAAVRDVSTCPAALFERSASIGTDTPRHGDPHPTPVRSFDDDQVCAQQLQRAGSCGDQFQELALMHSKTETLSLEEFRVSAEAALSAADEGLANERPVTPVRRGIGRRVPTGLAELMVSTDFHSKLSYMQEESCTSTSSAEAAEGCEPGVSSGGLSQVLGTTPHSPRTPRTEMEMDAKAFKKIQACEERRRSYISGTKEAAVQQAVEKKTQKHWLVEIDDRIERAAVVTVMRFGEKLPRSKASHGRHRRYPHPPRSAVVRKGPLVPPALALADNDTEQQEPGPDEDVPESEPCGDTPVSRGTPSGLGAIQVADFLRVESPTGDPVSPANRGRLFRGRPRPRSGNALTKESPDAATASLAPTMQNLLAALGRSSEKAALLNSARLV